jgi:RNA polymerase sigma factor (sigma-70 family)
MNLAEQSAGAAPGGNGWFNTTHWSVVLLAGKEQTPQGEAALEHLCRTYWHPLYVFIRRQGYNPEDAQDLTQQFFARLLERNDFGEVDPHKGRFRTFLLTSLTHFLSNERDRVQAAKRGGGRKIISLDEIQAGEFYRFEPASELSPDKLFDQRWAMVVLEQALHRLREELAAGGKAAQFEELKPYLTEEPGEGEYAKVAARVGQTPQAVAVTVYRLRQRYRELVRAEVAQTVSSPLELEREMRHLLEALNL